MKRTLTILSLTLFAACAREESKHASGIPPYSPPSSETASTAPPAATTQTSTMPSPIQVTTSPGSLTPPVPQPFATDTAPRIELSQAQQAMAANAAVVVDVRTAESYQKGHIRGAIHIPESEIAARAGELPRDKMIITYCT